MKPIEQKIRELKRDIVNDEMLNYSDKMNLLDWLDKYQLNYQRKDL